MTLVSTRRGDEEIEKEACFILGLLAIKQEHQHAIADEGALAGLVNLLKRYLPATNLSQGPGASLVRRAADAVTNLAHENVVIKSRVRAEGGIPPLVHLLVSLQAHSTLLCPLHSSQPVDVASCPAFVCKEMLWCPAQASIYAIYGVPDHASCSVHH